MIFEKNKFELAWLRFLFLYLSFITFNFKTLKASRAENLCYCTSILYSRALGELVFTMLSVYVKRFKMLRLLSWSMSKRIIHIWLLYLIPIGYSYSYILIMISLYCCKYQLQYGISE